LTRRVEDAAIMLGVLAGFDASDPGCADQPVPEYRAALDGSVRGMRIAICRNHFFGRNQPAVERAVERAVLWFSNQGAELRDVTVPNLEYGLGAIFAIELSSSTAYHDVSLRTGRTKEFTPDVAMLVELGRFVTGPDYLKAEQYRHVLMADFHKLFREVDLVIGPTLPITAPRIGESTVEVADGQESALAATWRLTYPYNLTGLPAISLPCGFDGNGLPIGLQIAGRPFDEASVLRAAHAYEAAHDWKTGIPPPCCINTS
jgi:aspartyl-tRNA(Asn)/glutamyl-tRNA(Gln) amidotransferase subunit A